ncbi:MAG: hypothetical protein JNL98_04550 [Bryobacterales bacterium]|nr:hypothetical protein [Bryobacterales bacterium]
MTRYLPSKQYQYAGVAAMVLALFCAILAWNLPLIWIPAGLFLITGGLVLMLGFVPAIEIHETHLAIGDRLIAWDDIKRLDRTGFISPLVLHLTLNSNRRILLIYPGGLEGSNSLLRHLRRMCRQALIDGIPYRQFWGEAIPPQNERKGSMPSPKYHLLLPDDEAEVERLYQRLKSVGHLDRSEDK